MQGIIILEGADGAGKTTLARYLVDHHRAVYLHHGYHAKAHWGRRYLASLRRAARLAQAGRLVVLDRAYLSADAYGTVFRGRSDVAKTGRLLHRLALTWGALTIICHSAYDQGAHESRVRAGREMYTDVSKVASWYEDLAYGFTGARAGAEPGCYSQVVMLQRARLGGHPAWGLYDWRRHGNALPEITRGIFHRLAQLRAAQPAFALDPANQNFAGWLGSAQLLLVGDEPGPRAGRVRWPFVTASETQGCSPWFADQLNRAQLLEEHLAWTNAHGTPDELPALLELQHWRLVVAFGRRAKERLREATLVEARGAVPLLELPHPQSWKRFQHDKPFYLAPLTAYLRKEKTDAA